MKKGEELVTGWGHRRHWKGLCEKRGKWRQIEFVRKRTREAGPPEDW